MAKIGEQKMKEENEVGSDKAIDWVLVSHRR